MILIPIGDRFALIDDEDSDLLSLKWHALSRSNTTYAKRNGQQTAGVREKNEYLHVVIARRIGIRGQVDHRNRLGLDCRRENLRSATGSQNTANQAIDNTNTSGYKGVSLHCQRCGKWTAKIEVNGNKEHIGTFAKASDAALAYNNRALKAWGEFAVINRLD